METAPPTHTGPAPSLIQLTVTPLSAQSFADYGQVIAFPSSSDNEAIGIAANHGTARRINHAAQLSNLRPVSSKLSCAAQPNLALFRCEPPADLRDPTTVTHFPLRILERHQWSTQTFLPVASTPSLHSGNGGYLVVVALNGPDNRPDLSTLAAFRATALQGINYNANVWHHPMIALKTPMDFACLVWENDMTEEDCEEVNLPVDVVINLE
ncbi:ureidoglycolate hydrolase [Syncephalis plumigaleata]|nr:ureidoglycolate hydrolase [Syncephalis plumigaleata]